MKKVIQKAALEGGKILLKYFRTDGIKDLHKKDSIVTKADLESEKKILSIIQKHYPDYNIFSEEIGHIDRGSKYTWAIDPLDGTTNFTKGNPFFSISIALLYENEPMFGLVYIPFMDEMYIAEKNKGAYLNNKKIRVSRKRELKGAELVMCEGNLKTLARPAKIFSKLGPKVKDIKKLGSAAIECVYVATGRADAYISTQINPYDVAAGIILISEAGGIVSDFKGKKWPMKTADFVGSNKRLYVELIKSIKNL